MKCKDCKIDKTHRLSLKKNRNGRNVYVDELGQRWNGLQCAKCKCGVVAKTLSHRKCGCGKPIEKSRYFVCESCKPVLESDPGFTMPW